MTTRDPSSVTTRSFPPTGWMLLAGAAVVAGVVHAAWLSWVTDDAFISFRYAENLTRGLGLVFNAGERVEGYSNFLWTMWCALGIALGADPVPWSLVSGIACFGGTITVLAALARRHALAPASGLAALPIAATAMAAHRDAAIFATSGLETASFTLLAVTAYAVVVEAPGRPRRLAVAALLFALVALSRPDGALFAAVAAGYVAVVSRSRVRDLAAFGLPLAAILLPYAVWKLAYYGDLLPNTYYAKSAHRPWYDQGLVYTQLYFRKYWPFALGLVLAAAAAWRVRWGHGNRDATAALEDRAAAASRWRRATGLAAANALAYTWYVTHVGGDFMYARLLVPAAPFLAIVLERAIEALARERTLVRAGAGVAAVAAIAMTPYPFQGEGWVRGIANEWAFYSEDKRERSREYGLYLRGLFDGLPIRMAFCGGQAVLAYYSRAPLAIETATGLTDSTIARQPLGARARPGHEKITPIPYLIERRTHFWTWTARVLSDTLAPYIPLVPMQLDTLGVMVMTWDPPVMDALRARGARFQDFLVSLDQFIAAMSYVSDEEVRLVWEKSRRFYFDHVPDPAREAPFRARLGIP